ncbi:Uncharacterised protein [Mycobacteroides abscessus subsp. abscessus]|nr:Uncharacterised protein [Mycobacteroides abscessus subsp. abscessus]
MTEFEIVRTTLACRLSDAPREVIDALAQQVLDDLNRAGYTTVFDPRACGGR